MRPDIDEDECCLRYRDSPVEVGIVRVLFDPDDAFVNVPAVVTGGDGYFVFHSLSLHVGSNESTNQRSVIKNQRSIPSIVIAAGCKPQSRGFGWLGGVRLFVYSPAFSTGYCVRAVFSCDFYFCMFGTGDVKCAVGDGVYTRVAFYVQCLDSAEETG